MTEELDAAVGAAKMIGIGLRGLSLARSVLGDDGVLATHFDARGTVLSGEDRVNLERRELDGRPDVWWYRAQFEDYTFERIPLFDSGGVVEMIDMPREAGDLNPDSRYWRWVANPAPGVMRGRVGAGPGYDPNALVDFVVVGYSPTALVKHFSPS